MTSEAFLDDLQARFERCADFSVRCSATSTGCAFTVVYLSNYCDKRYVTESILKPLVKASSVLDAKTLPSLLAALPLSACTSQEEAVEKLLSGCAVLFGDGESGFYTFVADAKNDEGRSITEPNSEVAIRGPRQGFVESAQANVVMLRKILKTPQLKVEKTQVGNVSKTEVYLVYIDGIARSDILDTLKRKIQGVSLSSCIDSGYLEHFLQDNRFVFFSEVGNSEKPDKVAAKLMGGRIAVVCDGSPVVLTVPYLFIESVQSAEDYLKNAYYATFVRVLRFIGMFLALFLPALYVAALDFHKGALPMALYRSIEQSRSQVPFDVFTELFIILIIFEIIREVGIRMPKAVGDAVSIVGALILGDAAIKAGIASEPVIMVASLTAICNFMNPPHMNSNVLIRLLHLVLAKLFGFFGIALGFFALMTILCRKRSFGIPYLSPLAPFSSRATADTVLAFPLDALERQSEELTPYRGGKGAQDA